MVFQGFEALGSAVSARAGIEDFRRFWEVPSRDFADFQSIFKGSGRSWEDLEGFFEHFSQPASRQHIDFLLILLILHVSPPAQPAGWPERRRSKIHHFPMKKLMATQRKYKKVIKTTQNPSATLHTTILKWFELVWTLLATALAVFL